MEPAAGRPRHVVVVTVAHRGDDARIVHRQARSLLAAGHRVTLIAPTPPAASVAHDPAGLERVAVPRAVGRRRIGAWRAARREVRRIAANADLLLIHDPELVPWFARRRPVAPVVWDVHEDYVASIADRSYIPRPLRRPLRWVVERGERAAIARSHLLLAEDAYADRLGDHPVVPNGTWVPTELPASSAAFGGELPRLVYVGRVSIGRGAHELVAIGRALAGRAVVEIVGAADADVRDLIAQADRDGLVRWRGYLSNPEALDLVRGAFAGLSLLHDEPNYRHSRPTKLIEYLAQGTPVISTPLPLAADLVTRSGGGVLTTAYDGDPLIDEVVAAVDAWLADPTSRDASGASGHAYVLAHHAWQTDGERFVALIESWAR